MTLKRLLWPLLAALAVLACSPETLTPDPEEEGQEQTEPKDPEGPSHPEDPQEDYDDRTSVDVMEAGQISSTGAVFSGSYSEVSDAPESAGFEWGTSKSSLDGTVESTDELSDRRGQFSATLTGLEPDTEYFFRAYIKVPDQGRSTTYYSKILSFRTEAGDGPVVQADLPYLGCYEIPTLSLSNGKVLTGDETWGNTDWYRYDTTNPDQKVVVHTYKNSKGKTVRTYVILFDKNKKAPLLDCTAFNNGAWPRNNVGRNDVWKYDPALESSWQNSGVSGYSKGHLTASNDRQDNLDANHQTFYYSNQAPQYQTGFNDGVWNTLEQQIQGASPSGSDTLYVVNGLLYEDENLMSGGVPVPSHFYKCIMYCSFNSSGVMTGAQGAAYIYTNERQYKSWNDSSYKTTIDAIEQRTGFDFFPGVPDNFEEQAESGNSYYSL
ncbi:MAG: DNA/RNA non-specific endonuclease [Bacteroidales bacterium]|nr:DNA/RNA non-specific endonuclease [Bacteroidales bacterium]